MIEPPNSQNVAFPNPDSLPFRVISKTIGQGAYASIRKAVPRNANKPIIAVKFVNKEHAFKIGNVRPKTLKIEQALHHSLGKHQNIIQCFAVGEDHAWAWLCMELADGGDLFDKIEADEGVGVDVAHFYFTQLISAVSYMHSKGVAHRDLKPENILLSGTGDLKVADFGLAALFRKDGQDRLCNTICGSPPYIAPEIVAGPRSKRSEYLEKGYLANVADIWSCGVVLFVLLVGNTPWDEPTARSWEFNEYVQTDGRTTDELWENIPNDVLSLLRGMLKIDPQSRFTLDTVRTHPWFTRRNSLLSPSGTAANPIGLATQMLESLRIDFDAPSESQAQRQIREKVDAMDIDSLVSTQPVTPGVEMSFDWERPHPLLSNISASQPTTMSNGAPKSTQQLPFSVQAMLGDDPTLSQFSQTPSVPLSLTQAARCFKDIVPTHSLARFLSPLSMSLLLPLLVEALQRLGVPVPPLSDDVLRGQRSEAGIRIKTVDGRKQGLSGMILVERLAFSHEVPMLEVRFVRWKADPLEWRRFFKKVVVECRDGVLVPG